MFKFEIGEPLGFEREISAIRKDLEENDYGSFTSEEIKGMIHKWLETVIEGILEEAYWYLFRNEHPCPTDRAFWELVWSREEQLPDPPDIDDDLPGNEADAQTLAMAGWGTDEDYFHFHDDDDY